MNEDKPFGKYQELFEVLWADMPGAAAVQVINILKPIIENVEKNDKLVAAIENLR